MKTERKWTGKSVGNKTGYEIFIFLLKYFGLRAAYLLLLFVAFYYIITKWHTNKCTFQYFRNVGFSKFKACVSVYKNYFVFGQTLIDRVAVMAGLNKKFSFNFDGEVHLISMQNANKGGIMLSAHAGNWEIAGYFLDRLTTPIHILMVDVEYQKVKNYLENVTGKRKANVITIKDDQSHLYEILEAINKNEIVCIHADRLLSNKQRAITMPFFNIDANFPYSIFKMIVTLNVPVAFVFAFKEKGLHYHFFSSEVKNFNSTDKEENVKAITHDFVLELEHKLRLYPLQWFNYYNFWERTNKC